MKFILTFKTPDVLEQVLGDYLEEDDIPQEIMNTAVKFIEYDEFIRIEFDTESNTATVLPIT